MDLRRKVLVARGIQMSREKMGELVAISRSKDETIRATSVKIMRRWLCREEKVLLFQLLVHQWRTSAELTSAQKALKEERENSSLMSLVMVEKGSLDEKVEWEKDKLNVSFLLRRHGWAKKRLLHMVLKRTRGDQAEAFHSMVANTR